MNIYPQFDLIVKNEVIANMPEFIELEKLLLHLQISIKDVCRLYLDGYEAEDIFADFLSEEEEKYSEQDDCFDSCSHISECIESLNSSLEKFKKAFKDKYGYSITLAQADYCDSVISFNSDSYQYDGAFFTVEFNFDQKLTEISSPTAWAIYD